MMTNRCLAVVALSFLLAVPALAQPVAPATPLPGVDPRPPNGVGQKPAFAGQTRAPEHRLNVAFDIVTVASVAEPWGLAVLPDGRLLVTERTGALRIVAADGTVSPPVAGLPAVDARAQGGLLDIALDPAHASNRLIYWSYAEPHDDRTNNTAVARGVLVDGAQPRVDQVEVIYHQAPAMANTPLHYGSRLVFGRDGTLFVTQGDRSITAGRMQAQHMDSLIGKIVRINRDGSIPRDNPFVGRPGVRPEIWSIGHRNVEAATLHPATGELWEVEMGTRGGDELNIARRGKDYGWPTIAYGIEYQGGPITGGIQARDGMEQPLYYWDPVIAPSGLLFYTGDRFPAWKGSLFIGGLGARALVRLTLDGEKVIGEERLVTDLQPRAARIRDVRQGPDGAIYVLAEGGTGPVFGPPGAQPPTPPGRILKLVPNAEAAVRAVVKLYTDGTFEGDGAKLRQAFHPRAVMNGYLQGKALIGGPEPFIAQMEKVRMKDTGAPYRPDITLLDVQGRVAQVTLRERGFMGSGEFTNYFHLIDDGSGAGWRIISKTFTSVP